jgi:hypothetical protein
VTATGWGAVIILAAGMVAWFVLSGIAAWKLARLTRPPARVPGPPAPAPGIKPDCALCGWHRVWVTDYTGWIRKLERCPAHDSKQPQP